MDHLDELVSPEPSVAEEVVPGAEALDTVREHEAADQVGVRVVEEDVVLEAGDPLPKREVDDRSEREAEYLGLEVVEREPFPELVQRKEESPRRGRSPQRGDAALELHALLVPLARGVPVGLGLLLAAALGVATEGGHVQDGLQAPDDGVQQREVLVPEDVGGHPRSPADIGSRRATIDTRLPLHHSRLSLLLPPARPVTRLTIEQTGATCKPRDRRVHAPRPGVRELSQALAPAAGRPARALTCLGGEGRARVRPCVRPGPAPRR